MHIYSLYCVSKHFLCTCSKGLYLAGWIAHPGGVNSGIRGNAFFDCDLLAGLPGKVNVIRPDLYGGRCAFSITEDVPDGDAVLVRIAHAAGLTYDTGNDNARDRRGGPGLVDLHLHLQGSVHPGVELVDGTLSGIRCQLRPGVVIGHLLRRYPVRVILVCDMGVQSALYLLRTACRVEVQVSQVGLGQESSCGILHGNGHFPGHSDSHREAVDVQALRDRLDRLGRIAQAAVVEQSGGIISHMGGDPEL